MRRFLAFLIRYSGLALLIRETICRTKATIIMYHAPEPHILESHLAYITKHFTIISLQRLVDAIQSNDRQMIPPKSLIITFDDGHKGNFSILGVLKKYNVPVTIYICSQIVGTSRHYWFLDFTEQAKQLKELPNSVRLKKLFSFNAYTPKKEFTVRQALSIKEILEMKHHGIDFQSHTRTHPILVRCSDDLSLQEIVGAKEDLENILNSPVTHFAYPNGDYGDREIDYLQKAGYQSARTVDVGWNTLNTNVYALKVMAVSDDATLNEMVAQLHGIFPSWRELKKRIKKILVALGQ